MNENIFDKLDFGPLHPLLDNDDITDISYCNNGQIWIRSLTQGSMRVEVEGATPEFVEKLAFQCSNVMGTTFNNAKPFLDAESSELRLNFVHQSIATNGIALVIRKTPAKIRLEKDKLLNEEYFTNEIHDLLIKCVQGHCNIMVAGETGSGKTEFVKYLASHTKTNEKIITIEDTLELHLDRIFPQRDIVAMKTNNVASYSDVLVTCMRQNPKWILLSEVRSAEAVSAVRNSISSGHNILSTIHADKASAIPYRLYSLMETDLDVHQFLTTIYRYIQLGVHIKAYYSKKFGKFHREVDEVTEFYVDEENNPQSRVIYQKLFGKTPMMRKPSPRLIEYLENQNIDISEIIDKLPDDMPFKEQSLEQENQEEQPVETEIQNEETKQTENTQVEEQVVINPEINSEEVSVQLETQTIATPEINPEEKIITVEEQVINAEEDDDSDIEDEIPENDSEEDSGTDVELENNLPQQEQKSELELAMAQEQPNKTNEENVQLEVNPIEVSQIEMPTQEITQQEQMIEAAPQEVVLINPMVEELPQGTNEQNQITTEIPIPVVNNVEVTQENIPSVIPTITPENVEATQQVINEVSQENKNNSQQLVIPSFIQPQTAPAQQNVVTEPKTQSSVIPSVIPQITKLDQE